MAPKELGSVFLQKPFTLEDLSAWLDEREPLMDLSQPLSAMWRDTRHESREEVTCLTSPDQNYLKSLVVNRCPSGICLDVDAPLLRGTCR